MARNHGGPLDRLDLGAGNVDHDVTLAQVSAHGGEPDEVGAKLLQAFFHRHVQRCQRLAANGAIREQAMPELELAHRGLNVGVEDVRGAIAGRHVAARHQPPAQRRHGRIVDADAQDVAGIDVLPPACLGNALILGDRLLGEIDRLLRQHRRRRRKACLKRARGFFELLLGIADVVIDDHPRSVIPAQRNAGIQRHGEDARHGKEGQFPQRNGFEESHRFAALAPCLSRISGSTAGLPLSGPPDIPTAVFRTRSGARSITVRSYVDRSHVDRSHAGRSNARRSNARRSLHHEPLRARSPSRTATSGPGLWLPRIARLGQIGTSLWQHMLRFRGGNAAGSAREVPKMQQRREKARELRVRGPVSHLRPVSCRRLSSLRAGVRTDAPGVRA